MMEWCSDDGDDGGDDGDEEQEGRGGRISKLRQIVKLINGLLDDLTPFAIWKTRMINCGIMMDYVYQWTINYGIRSF